MGKRYTKLKNGLDRQVAWIVQGPGFRGPDDRSAPRFFTGLHCAAIHNAGPIFLSAMSVFSI